MVKQRRRGQACLARLTGAINQTVVTLAVGLILVTALSAQPRLLVTAFDEKTGEAASGLTASNFSVKDGSIQLGVEAAQYSTDPMDLMLVVDTSFAGQAVRSLVIPIIQGIEEGEQIAIVGFDEGATVLQDFTSSSNALIDGIMSARYGNNPRALDALFAALDGGFENTTGRRVILLLSAGVEGRSGTPATEVFELARRRKAMVHVVYHEAADVGLFRRIAQRTGGLYLHSKRLKLEPKELAERVWASIRGYYELTLSGVNSFGDRVEVEVVGLPKSKKKVVATGLPIE